MFGRNTGANCHFDGVLLGRDGHDDLGCPQNPVTGFVPGAQDLADGVDFDIRARLLDEGLVDRRVELHAGLIDAHQAVRLQRVLQLGGDRGERSVREVTMLAGGVDVVQHRQEEFRTPMTAISPATARSRSTRLR